MANPKKEEIYLGKGKLVSFHKGIELMGSKSTLTQRESDMDVYPWGLKVTSKKTKRCFVIYSDNIQAVELLTNDALE